MRSNASKRSEGVYSRCASGKGSGLPMPLSSANTPPRPSPTAAASCAQATRAIVHAARRTNGVFGPFVPGRRRTERVALAIGIKEHRLRLRWRLDPLAGRRDWAAKVERPEVGAGGPRDEPDAIGLERVDLEPRVVAEVRNCDTARTTRLMGRRVCARGSKRLRGLVRGS
eukprot:5954037-Prymnesium_polylepis.2